MGVWVVVAAAVMVGDMTVWLKAGPVAAGCGVQGEGEFQVRRSAGWIGGLCMGLAAFCGLWCSKIPEATRPSAVRCIAVFLDTDGTMDLVPSPSMPVGLSEDVPFDIPRWTSAPLVPADERV